ncbi:MAG: beta-galactosidase trimerization domain-containing protein [Anaerolineae bacterium]|nr:beta-galactosidase trimerization domain-containing protein [Anaerolineae bacterium]
MVSRRDAFFGIHFDLHANVHDTELGADVTEPMIERLLERVRPDYIQQDCKGHPGFASYPTKVGTPSPGIVKDALAIWRKVTQRYGVGLFIHYSGVIDQQAVAQHPEWAARTAGGEPAPNGATSTFGPYVDELMLPQLKEVFGAYDLDGAWIDGECWGTVVDYSPMALTAWEQATGLKHAPLSAQEPHWHAWLAFHREQFERYLTHYLDELHAFRQDLEITSNWMYTGFAPRPVRAPLDFISGDYSAQDSVNTARFEARYIASTGMPWDLMAWGFSWWGDGSTRHRSYKPAVHLKQEAAVVLAQGGGFQVYYQPTRAGWVDDQFVGVLGEVADFCRARQAVSHKTESVPQVALLLSSAAFYDKTNSVLRAWEGEHNALHGALHALLEGGYSVDVLAEHQIQDRLDAYPVVVLPEVHTLASDFRQALVDYVHGGGSLVLIGSETAGLFAEELGVTLEGEPQECRDYLGAMRPMGMCEGLWQPVTPTTGDVVGYRYPTHDSRKGSVPAATVNAVGAGKIAAIYGPLGSVHLRCHTPQVRVFLAEVVRAVFPAPLVEIEGPPCVDLAVRRKDGNLLVHLTNLAEMQVTSAYTIRDYIPPVGPLTLRIRMDAPPVSVTRVPEGPVDATWDDGTLVVRLPALAIHTVVVVS